MNNNKISLTIPWVDKKDVMRFRKCAKYLNITQKQFILNMVEIVEKEMEKND